MREPELERALIDATQHVLDRRQAILSNALGRVERAWFAGDLTSALRERGVTTNSGQFSANEPDLQIFIPSNAERAVVDFQNSAYQFRPIPERRQRDGNHQQH